MERLPKWLIVVLQGPLGKLLARRLVVAILAGLLGALGAVGLELGPAVQCLESALK